MNPGDWCNRELVTRLLCERETHFQHGYTTIISPLFWFAVPVAECNPAYAHTCVVCVCAKKQLWQQCRDRNPEPHTRRASALHWAVRSALHGQLPTAAVNKKEHNSLHLLPGSFRSVIILSPAPCTFTAPWPCVTALLGLWLTEHGTLRPELTSGERAAAVLHSVGRRHED